MLPIPFGSDTFKSLMEIPTNVQRTELTKDSDASGRDIRPAEDFVRITWVISKSGEPGLARQYRAWL